MFAAFYRALEALTASGVTVVAEGAFTSRLAVDVKQFSSVAPSSAAVGTTDVAD